MRARAHAEGEAPTWDQDPVQLAQCGALSGKYWSPCSQNTTSKAASEWRRSAASAACHSTAAAHAVARVPATAIISGFRSTLTTWPEVPIRFAAWRATIPVPQAASRTRSPARNSWTDDHYVDTTTRLLHQSLLTP
jgi:hypothetical protein